MLVLSDTFVKESNLHNPNRVLLVRMWHGDNTSYTGFSSRTCVVDDVQYLGATVKFNAPKSVWNWLGNNNVTTAVPSLSLANIETPDGFSWLDDNLYNNTYLGRKIQIYVGYQGYADSTNYALIYEGKTDDLVYKQSVLDVKFKATELPNIKVSGRELDPENGTVGSGTETDMDISCKGKTIPMVYGEHWNTPIVYYKNPSNGDHYYMIQDTHSTFPNYLASGSTFVNNYHINLGMNSQMLYAGDNGMLSPIGRITPSDGAYRWGTLENANDWYEVHMNQEADEIQGDNIYLNTPMRFKESDIDDNDVYGNGDNGNITNRLGSMSNIADLGVASYTVTHTGTGYCTTDAYYEYEYGSEMFPDYRSLGWGAFVGWEPVAIDWRWNLRGIGDSDTVVHERPIHVPDDQGIANDTLMMTKISGTFNGGGTFPQHCSFFITDIVKDVDSTNHQVGWVHQGLRFNGYNFKIPQFWSSPKINRLNNYEGLDGAGLTWASGGTGPLASYWPYGDIDLIEGSTEPYDAILSGRQAWEDYKVGFKILMFARAGISEVVTINEMVLSHQGSEPLGGDLYGEARGIQINNEDMACLADGGATVLNRPYQYLESMLRMYVSDNDDDYSSQSWADMAGIWDDLYGTYRDGSGFTLTETIKFGDFMNKYMRGELFTVYKDEFGKFNTACFKKTYSVTDVDATVSYSDLDTLEMGLTPLKNVYTDIGSLSTDRVYFDKSYASVSPFYVSDSTYAYDHYDIENSYTTGRFSLPTMEKQYTSFSTPYVLNFGDDSAHSYECLRFNHSDSTTNGWDAVDFDTYWASTTRDAALTSWTGGKDYGPYSAEADVLASAYINQFANRHRLVDFSTRNMEYYKLQIGDVLEFYDVPQTLLGMEIQGFGSNAHPETTVYNGQTVYGYFVVTSVAKNLNKIDVQCAQLHKLDSLSVTRGRQ